MAFLLDREPKEFDPRRVRHQCRSALLSGIRQSVSRLSRTPRRRDGETRLEEPRVRLHDRCARPVGGFPRGPLVCRRGLVLHDGDASARASADPAAPSRRGGRPQRRKRAPSDPEIWAAHLTVVDGEAIGAPEFETDRARFLGRSHTVRAPIAVMDSRPLSNSVGAVLDPIFSIRRRIRVAPGATVRVAYWTIAAASRWEGAQPPLRPPFSWSGKRNFACRDWRAIAGAERGRTAGIRFADRAAPR